jgi:hypothetical protein
MTPPYQLKSHADRRAQIKTIARGDAPAPNRRESVSEITHALSEGSFRPAAACNAHTGGNPNLLQDFNVRYKTGSSEGLYCLQVSTNCWIGQKISATLLSVSITVPNTRTSS